jgi:hypothetical protein
VVGFVEPDHLKGEDLRPEVGRIPEGGRQVNLPEGLGLLS